MFERSFDASIIKKEEVQDIQEPVFEPEIPLPSFTEQDISVAKEESLQKGRIEGREEANNTIEDKILKALAHLEQQLIHIKKQHEEENKNISEMMTQIAVTIVKKCFPNLSKESGVSEIEHVLKKVLSEISDEPRITIKINTELKEEFSARLDTIIKGENFSGEVLLEGNENINIGECQIVWSNGLAERNFAQIWCQIDTIVNSNFSAYSPGSSDAKMPIFRPSLNIDSKSEVYNAEKEVQNLDENTPISGDDGKLTNDTNSENAHKTDESPIVPTTREFPGPDISVALNSKPEINNATEDPTLPNTEEIHGEESPNQSSAIDSEKNKQDVEPSVEEGIMNEDIT